jgi:hypothetical protein
VARTALARSYYANAAYYELLLGELKRILAGIERAGVPVVVLKGMALAQVVYPEPALRPMNDIDLLVPAQSLRAAMRVMRQCGYGLRKATYHLLFKGGPRQQVSVELHWNLDRVASGQKQAFLQGVWDRSLVLDGGLGHGLVMSPEDQLLHLAAHLAFQHPGDLSRLIWFYDIHRLLEYRAEGLQWDALLERARQWQWEGALFYALEGCRQRLGTPLPQGLLQELGRQGTITPKDRQRWLQGWVWEAQAELDWGLRLRLAASLVFPHPEYMRWRYRPRPAWLWPLYYPLRWWRGLLEWVSANLRRYAG